jgi:hypothetical protein
MRREHEREMKREGTRRTGHNHYNYLTAMGSLPRRRKRRRGGRRRRKEEEDGRNGSALERTRERHGEGPGGRETEMCPRWASRIIPVAAAQ